MSKLSETTSQITRTKAQKYIIQDPWYLRRLTHDKSASSLEVDGLFTASVVSVCLCRVFRKKIQKGVEISGFAGVGQ